MIIKERYKVIRVLKLEEHYAALHAVDITARSNEQYIVNVYDGDLVKPYVGYFSTAQRCPGFVEMFVRDGSLAAVFRYSDGQDMDLFFRRGNSLSGRECIEYADRLFDEALAVSDLSPYISCPLMLSSQLRPDPEDKKIRMKYVIEPMRDMNERELALLLRDQIVRILDIRFTTCMAVRKYVRNLRRSNVYTVAQMCSEWRSLRKTMYEETDALEGKMTAASAFGIIRVNIADMFSQLFRNGRR